ncbi:MAG: methyltransferase [Alphaproteobacteria bacterium]|jgi:predicted methyltransferase|nr:methyltransferase [Alphaproteobacteria bacterium]
MKHLFFGAAMAGLLTLGACETMTGAESPAGGTAKLDAADEARLESVLAGQPDEIQARYDARNPAETIAFFGLEPGMTLVEALPGGGWYTKILMPYLGEDGRLIGAHYPDDMWARILPNATEERIAGIIERTDKWAETAREWAGEDGPEVGSVKLTTVSGDMAGQADAVLFIRAMHNLRRVEDDLGYFTKAAQEAHMLLRPGGVVGVVQHRAGEETPDEWANGSAGYLKQSDVIATFEAAGLELEATSEINANPVDTAGPGDIVWRLPPSLGTTEAGTPERAAMEAIGESDRMTLRFRKPG